jgi:Flp pilus assembly protein TadG
MINKTGWFGKYGHRRENGQAALFLMLGLGLFLLGGIGFAVDMANLWMHRQSSQNAADAACTAAAMDMVNAANGAPNTSGFTPGTQFNCSGNSGAAPCQYAALNGYSANGLTAGSPSIEVAVDNRSSVSVPGVQTCSGTVPPPSICTETGFPASPAFVRVTVTDRIQSFFLGLLSGGTTMDVGATASCGAILSNAPIPILVLDPRNETSVDNNGNFSIQIVGGPQRSIQVDSSSSSAVNVSGGSGTFDLSQGGPFSPPATNGTGSDFGVTGTESATNYNGGTTGTWISPSASLSDPFATLPPPAAPGPPTVPADVSGAPANCTSTKIAAGNCQVALGVHGCPSTTCTLYTSGAYTGGITVGQGSQETAIFDPGVYYITNGNGLDLRSNSCVRPSTSTGDGSGGTMFYFADSHSVNVNNNSGAAGKCPAAKVPLSQVQCITSGPGTTVLPGNVTTFGGLAGNVLLGPCQAPTAGGTNYGDPLGVNDPLGEQRGMLFFQNRDSTNVVGTWDGGGSFGLAGMMYFHSCLNGAGNGGGGGCSTTTGFTDSFHLQGGACSSTFVIGDIVTDKLHLGGNPCVEMDLNPNALYYVLKASLLQ